MSRFVIQPDRSHLKVRARSSLHPIHGTGPLNGHVDATVTNGTFDPSAPTTGTVELQIESLRGEDEHFDEEMKRRLDAHRYPTITGTIKRAQPSGNGDGRYHMIGDLTFHGQTRTVEGDIKVRFRGERYLQAEGALQLDIRDFGIKPPKVFMLKVHPEIEVNVDVIAEVVDD
jgi:polyisoprenoid-binding protein YceI